MFDGLKIFLGFVLFICGLAVALALIFWGFEETFEWIKGLFETIQVSVHDLW